MFYLGKPQRSLNTIDVFIPGWLNSSLKKKKKKKLFSNFFADTCVFGLLKYKILSCFHLISVCETVDRRNRVHVHGAAQRSMDTMRYRSCGVTTIEAREASHVSSAPSTTHTYTHTAHKYTQVCVQHRNFFPPVESLLLSTANPTEHSHNCLLISHCNITSSESMFVFLDLLLLLLLP